MEVVRSGRGGNQPPSSFAYVYENERLSEEGGGYSSKHLSANDPSSFSDEHFVMRLPIYSDLASGVGWKWKEDSEWKVLGKGSAHLDSEGYEYNDDFRVDGWRKLVRSRVRDIGHEIMGGASTFEVDDARERSGSKTWEYIRDSVSGGWVRPLLDSVTLKVKNTLRGSGVEEEGVTLEQRVESFRLVRVLLGVDESVEQILSAVQSSCRKKDGVIRQVFGKTIDSLAEFHTQQRHCWDEALDAANNPESALKGELVEEQLERLAECVDEKYLVLWNKQFRFCEDRAVLEHPLSLSFWGIVPEYMRALSLVVDTIKPRSASGDASLLALSALWEMVRDKLGLEQREPLLLQGRTCVFGVTLRGESAPSSRTDVRVSTDVDRYNLMIFPDAVVFQQASGGTHFKIYAPELLWIKFSAKSRAIMLVTVEEELIFSVKREQLEELHEETTTKRRWKGWVVVEKNDPEGAQQLEHCLEMLQKTISLRLSQVGAIGKNGLRRIRYRRFPDVTFVGEAKAGQFHGNGYLDNASCFYIGAFVDGEMEGSGVMANKEEGWTFQGSWKGSKMHGKGVMHFPLTQDGRYKFVGKFRDGIEHGAGMLYFLRDGVKHTLKAYWRGKVALNPVSLRWEDKLYTGGWYGEQRSGFGVAASAAERFYGEFVSDKRSGSGTLFGVPGASEKDSRWMSGMWVDGKMSGAGLVRMPGGRLEGTITEGSTLDRKISFSSCAFVPSNKRDEDNAATPWRYYVVKRFSELEAVTAKTLEGLAQNVAGTLGDEEKMVASLMELFAASLRPPSPYYVIIEEYMIMAVSLFKFEVKNKRKWLAQNVQDFHVFVMAVCSHVFQTLTGDNVNVALKPDLERLLPVAIEKSLFETRPHFQRILLHACKDDKRDRKMKRTREAFRSHPLARRLELFFGEDAVKEIVSWAAQSGKAPLSSTVARFDSIAQRVTISGKLDSLRQWFKEAIRENEEMRGKGKSGADDVLPVLLYSVAMSQIEQLLVEFTFMDLFMLEEQRDEVMHNGELAYVWTSLSAAISFLLNLSLEQIQKPINVSLEEFSMSTFMERPKSRNGLEDPFQKYEQTENGTPTMGRTLSYPYLPMEDLDAENIEVVDSETISDFAGTDLGLPTVRLMMLREETEKYRDQEKEKSKKEEENNVEDDNNNRNNDNNDENKF